MKKNININLTGIIFNIDEDAYELLQRYTDTLRHHYRYTPEGAEVVNDIEARIAELFSELKTQGHMAVTIEDVQDIIHRIGEVEEIAKEEASDTQSEQPAQDNPQDNKGYTQQEEYVRMDTAAEEFTRRTRSYWDSLKSRRFYRDGSDKKLAGVLSGCAAYLGGNALWWRVGFVVLTLFVFQGDLFWITLLGYLLLAILAPEASSPEEQLRMKGREVNPQNLADEVTRQSQQEKKDGNTVWNVLCAIVLVLIGLPAICWGIIFLIITLTLAFIPSMLITFLPMMELGTQDAAIMDILSQHMHMPWLVSLAVTMGIGIIAYCCVHGVCSCLGAVKSMGYQQRIVWFVLWLACTAFAYIGITRIVTEVTSEVLQIEQQEKRQKQEDFDKTHSTHYGKTFRNVDWEWFQQEGWRLIENDKCDDYRVTTVGQHFTGNDTVRYLDAFNGRGNHAFTAERSQQVQPGRYRLLCATRSAKEGPYVYLREGGSITQEKVKTHATALITHLGNTGGELWEWAVGAKSADEANIPQSWRKNDELRSWIASANEGAGYGWGITVVVDNLIVEKHTTFFYGVSNNDKHRSLEVGSTHSAWFSASDFILEKY